MFEAIFNSTLAVSAMGAAFIACLVVVSAIHFNRQREYGWLHLCFYAIFLTVAVSIAFSGRDLTNAAWLADLSSPSDESAPVKWMSRFVSIFLLLASGERVGATWFRFKSSAVAIPFLVPVFVIFWICTVATPSLFGAYPYISHEFIYPLLIGWGILLLTSIESELAVIAARNSTIVIIGLGYCFIPFKAGLVLEANYSQGYIPGLPRMAGLTPHALTLGLIVQIALLCLWVKPFQGYWLNRGAWALGLFTLFLTQSKTAWLSFGLCAIIMSVIRNGKEIRKRLFDSEKPLPGMLFIIFSMLVFFGGCFVLMFSNAGAKLLLFFDSSEGAKLLTLNGREQIWNIAFAEWHRHPIWGYGPSLFSAEYRSSIGLLNATHAHNQFVDTLARAGAVGAAALVIYVACLLFLSLKYIKVSGGLSLSLFLVLFLRGIGEVPLTLYGYSAEFAGHALLLVVLVSAAHVHRKNIFVRKNAVKSRVEFNISPA